MLVRINSSWTPSQIRNLYSSRLIDLQEYSTTLCDKQIKQISEQNQLSVQQSYQVWIFAHKIFSCSHLESYFKQFIFLLQLLLAYFILPQSI